MGTYYGYVNRDQDKSVIDWAGITKNISDDIIKEKNSREARRFELDKTQNEQLRKLDEYTQGIDKNANQAAMEAAQGYRDFLMENHKLMKAGLVSVNDSKIIKENAKSTWSTLNKTFKGHQDAIQAKIDQGGAGNLLLAEKMSTAFDFQNKKIVPSRNGEAVFVNIDPKTGKIDMKTAMPVSGLLNNQQRMWDTIDVQESASKAAKAASIYKYSPTSTRSIKNIRENEDFKDWKENTILAALDTPQRQASVLMDYLGVDPDDIKMVEDSQGILQPELTPKQIKAAKEAYGSALEIGLGYEETKEYVAPTVQSGRLQEEANVVKIIDDFVVRGQYSGLKATLGQVASNVTLDEENKTLTVELLDGIVKTIDLNRPQKDIGVEIAGIISPKTAGSYRNDGRGSLTLDVNQKALDSAIYTPISQKVSLSGSEIDAFNKQLSQIQYKEFGSEEIKFTSRPDIEVKSAVTAVARKLKLDPNQVTVTNGIMMYGDTQLGAIGTVTGSEVAQKLETIASGKRGRFDGLGE